MYFPQVSIKGKYPLNVTKKSNEKREGITADGEKTIIILVIIALIAFAVLFFYDMYCGKQVAAMNINNLEYCLSNLTSKV